MGSGAGSSSTTSCSKIPLSLRVVEPQVVFCVGEAATSCSSFIRDFPGVTVEYLKLLIRRCVEYSRPVHGMSLCLFSEASFEWSMHNFECSLSLGSARHTRAVCHVALSPDGTSVLSCADDGSARVWDARSGALRHTIPHTFEGGVICGGCFSPTDNIIAGIEDTHNVKLWCLDGSGCLGTLDNDDQVFHVSISPDGTTLCSCGDHRATMWSIAAQERIGDIASTFSQVTAVAWTPDSSGIILARLSLELWDVKDQRRLTSIGVGDFGVSESIYGVAVSPDGKYVAIGCRGSAPVSVFALASGERVAVLQEGQRDVLNVFWRGDLIITAAAVDNTVRIWSWAADTAAEQQPSATLLRTIHVLGDGAPHSDMQTYACAASACGRVIACSGGGGDDDNEACAQKFFLKLFRVPGPSALGEQLGALLGSQRGADVALACRAAAPNGGAEEGLAPAAPVLPRPAHSLVLALRSGTLRRQLEWGQEQRRPAAAAGASVEPVQQVVLIDESVEPAVLDRLLEYMYTDFLDIQSAEEAQHLLNAASFYDVPGLFALCLRELEARLAVENVAETLIAADKFGARAAKLRVAALRFIAADPAAVVAGPGWARVPAALVTEALLSLAAAAGQEGGEGVRSVRQRVVA